MTERDSLLATTMCSTTAGLSSNSVGTKWANFCDSCKNLFGNCFGCGETKHTLANNDDESMRTSSISTTITTATYQKEITEKIIQQEERKREIIKKNMLARQQDCDINLHKYREMSGIPSKYFEGSQTTIVEINE